MVSSFALLEVPLGEHRLLIADASAAADPLQLVTEDALPKGWRGVVAECGQIRFDPGATERGFQNLQLVENHFYRWKVVKGGLPHSISPRISSSLEEPGKARWRINKLDVDLSGDFSVTNYLGTATIRIDERHVLRLEIRSEKLGYETEYTAMVEAIATECQQLVLEWNSPTSVPFEKNSSGSEAGLLEQFLFVRNVLGASRLDFFFELLQRQPHTRLVRERNWVPTGTAPAGDFVSDPLRSARDWTPTAQATGLVFGDYSPTEIIEERQFESLDTPPNRFVRFALESFAAVCTRVIDTFSERRGTAYLEACALRQKLDGFLTGSFLVNVNQLDRIPYESQVLTKREGYRDILAAWLVLESAGQIKWPGREEAYDGTNRNVAILYEYWLYFVLRRGLRNLEGVRESNSDLAPAGLGFVTAQNGGPHINLRQGKTSLSVFSRVGSLPLRLHLYYNRSFRPSPDPLEPGTSYSRYFRPDFTIAVFPEDFAVGKSPREAEASAETAGCLTYIHLDAKYRVEEVAQVLGLEAHEEGEITDPITGELSDELARGTLTNTYNPGDLLKMHTYNDAIRRTAGAYVLYPGTDSGRDPFMAYHEIIPSVGAFVLRPMRSAAEVNAVGLGALMQFLEDVFEFHANRFSRKYRIDYFREQSLRDMQNTSSNFKIIPGSKPPHDIRALGIVAETQEDFDLTRTRRLIWLPLNVGTSKTPMGKDSPLSVEHVVCFAPDHGIAWTAPVLFCRLGTSNELVEIRGSSAGSDASIVAYFDLGNPEMVHGEDVSRFPQPQDEITRSLVFSWDQITSGKSGQPAADTSS